MSTIITLRPRAATHRRAFHPSLTPMDEEFSSPLLSHPLVSQKKPQHGETHEKQSEPPSPPPREPPPPIPDASEPVAAYMRSLTATGTRRTQSLSAVATTKPLNIRRKEVPAALAMNRKQPHGFPERRTPLRTQSLSYTGTRHKDDSSSSESSASSCSSSSSTPTSSPTASPPPSEPPSPPANPQRQKPRGPRPLPLPSKPKKSLRHPKTPFSPAAPYASPFVSITNFSAFAYSEEDYIDWDGIEEYMEGWDGNDSQGHDDPDADGELHWPNTPFPLPPSRTTRHDLGRKS
ncbi:hypothetical protein BD410DRAFT_780267 [Rickenella mellea]|uniref:Uncharacterized protein n=1 Tax=Rickenella mellea TaxID=50990 RepID=A0A4R5XHN1_9AGAM|nr:hypothetical protein BD410DRAFT_780267 [Rickenella mellea]